jgi:hypothetical protein
MSFPIDVVTIGGEVVEIKASDDWSVWEFERELEKSTDVHRNLYKLITREGVELTSGPLCDFCPFEEGGATIYLVKLPKSREEVEWFEKWSSEAPAWFKKMAEAPIGAKELQDLYDAPACPFLRGLYPPNQANSAPHPTKVLEEPAAKSRQEPLLKTSAEVLDVVRKSKFELQGIEMENIYKGMSDGAKVNLEWRRSKRQATLAAVSGAIREEPCMMLEPLKNLESYDLFMPIVLSVVAKHPEIYEGGLPDYLMEEREVLYVAMEADPVLKEEFLRMADRREIREWREWQYPKASRHSSCRWSKRCREE